LEDDALLEAVVLPGSLAGWQEGDRELAGSGLVSVGRQAGRHEALSVVSYTLAPRRGGDQTPLMRVWRPLGIFAKSQTALRAVHVPPTPLRGPVRSSENFSDCGSWDLNAGDTIT
jgi:hypothetical protein